MRVFVSTAIFYLSYPNSQRLVISPRPLSAPVFRSSLHLNFTMRLLLRIPETRLAAVEYIVGGSHSGRVLMVTIYYSGVGGYIIGGSAGYKSGGTCGGIVLLNLNVRNLVLVKTMECGIFYAIYVYFYIKSIMV